jgi:hypothetical protein
MAWFRAPISVDIRPREEGVVGKQKRIRIELVPREQPDVALYIRALLLTVQEQRPPVSVDAETLGDATHDEGTDAREATSC